jgi:hypothetical protein
MELAGRIKGTLSVPPAPGLIGRLTIPALGGPLFEPGLGEPGLGGGDYSQQPRLSLVVGEAPDKPVDVPALGRCQAVTPWIFRVGGRVVEHVLPGATWSEDLDGWASFSFAVPRRTASPTRTAEPLGSPRTWLGVPGGAQDVELEVAFLRPGEGRVSEVVLARGRMDNTSSSIDAEADVRSFTGGGASASWVDQPVELILPAGHRLQSSQVVRRLAIAAGVPTSRLRLTGGRRLRGRIEIAGQTFWEAANQVLEPELRRLRVTRDGALEAVALAGETRVSGVITENDVPRELGSRGDDAANDGPTELTLTASSQLTSEDCQTVTSTQVTRTFSTTPWRRAAAKQLADGTLTAAGLPTAPLPPLSGLYPQSIVIVTRVHRCGTLVSQRETIAEPFAPRVWRYSLDNTTDGAIIGYRAGSYLYDAGAAQDDSAEAYLWPAERMTVVSDTMEVHRYDEGRRLVEVETRRHRWELPEVPVKRRGGVPGGASPASTPWDEVPYASGLRVTGGGVGLDSDNADAASDPRETFYGPLSSVASNSGSPPGISGDSVGAWESVRPWEVTLQTFEPDVDNLLTAEAGATSRVSTRPATAGRYLYAGDGGSDDAAPTLRAAELETVTYSVQVTAEREHWRTTRRANLLTGKTETSTDGPLSGYRPRATLAAEEAPGEEVFEDGEDAEGAETPAGVQALEGTFRSGLLQSLRGGPRKGAGAAIPYAETEAELRALARHRVRELNAINVKVPLAFSPRIRPGQTWSVDLPSLAFSYRIRVDHVQHQQEEGATWTQVTGSWLPPL